MIRQYCNDVSSRAPASVRYFYLLEVRPTVFPLTMVSSRYKFSYMYLRFNYVFAYHGLASSVFVIDILSDSPSMI